MCFRAEEARQQALLQQQQQMMHMQQHQQPHAFPQQQNVPPVSGYPPGAQPLSAAPPPAQFMGGYASPHAPGAVPAQTPQVAAQGSIQPPTQHDRPPLSPMKPSVYYGDRRSMEEDNFGRDRMDFRDRERDWSRERVRQSKKKKKKKKTGFAEIDFFLCCRGFL